MKSFNVAEDGHVINLLPPIDINGGIVTTEVFSMRDHAHVSIVIQQGVVAASSTVTVEECDNFTPTTHPAIVFNYWAETVALGDTLAAKAAATVAGIALPTNNTTFYVIEIDAAQLSDGYPNLRLSFSNPGGSAIVSAIAILSGSRYAQESSRTAIA
jgi:hypothetical protein